MSRFTFSLLRFSLLLLSLLLLPLLASAQTHEIALLGGGQVNGANRVSVGPVSVSSGVGAAGALTYSLKFAQSGPVAWLADIPLVGHSGGRVSWDGSTAVASDANFFFTPGVRARLFPTSRVTPYLFFGAGVAVSDQVATRARPPYVSVSANSSDVALGYGGGADLEVWRWFNLRLELRNVAVRRGAGDLFSRTDWTNYPLLMGGVAFRF